LKESEKELCTPGSSLHLDEHNYRRDLELPLFNGFFKQATPPRLFRSRKERRHPSTKIGSTLRMVAAFLTSSTIQVITQEWPQYGRNSRTLDPANSFSVANQKYLLFLVQRNWLRQKSTRSGDICTSIFGTLQGLAPTVTLR
jgi:hypothetical protein